MSGSFLRARAMRPVIFVALAAAVAPAFADMYRYRDPETGQIKLTNVPPAWMKHRPQAVQVIAAPGAARAPAIAPKAPAPEATAAPPAAAAPASTLPPNAYEADRQRQLLLQQLVVEAPNVGTPAGRERFLARLGNVIGLETRLDKLDPSGRKAREAERDRALGDCADGFAQALKDPSAQREFTGELLRFLGDRVVKCARGPC